MSKRNHIVERASDVNGGQYVQTNPSYNSGYEDGKKAGKEYCASEIESLREQVEKLAKERDELKTVPMKYRRMQFNAELQDEVTQLQKQLAEQNAKMRKALTKWRYLDSSYNWRCGHCGNEVEDGHKEGCALSLPNLTSPMLNRIKAEAYREVANIVENIDVYTFVHGGSSYDDGGITLSSAATAIRAKADELEQSK